MHILASRIERGGANLRRQLKACPFGLYLFLFTDFRSSECQRKVVCEFWRNKSTTGHMQAMHSICYLFYLLIILWVCVSGLVNVRGRWSVSSGGTSPPVDTCKPCITFATRSNLLIVLWVCVSVLENVRGRWSVSSGETNPPVDTCMHSIFYSF